MKNNKLDALLWEHNMLNNFIIQGATVISQENLDEVPFEKIDKLSVLRDDDYNIKLICARNKTHYDDSASVLEVEEHEALVGSFIPKGKINVKLLDDFQITLEPCYYYGYTSKIDKTEYNLACNHLEGKSLSKKGVVLKEWLINGRTTGLCFCANKKFEYTVEGTTFGKYGDMEYPSKQFVQEQEYCGRFTHVKYKDTAFDVHYVGDTYGPRWSTNISISYYENYGRIPNNKERNAIREYMSFLAGKKLIYTGESHYDAEGNVVGFVMESPNTYGMDIKRVCANAGVSPIRDDYRSAQNYFETFTKYIEVFEELYEKLDFKSFFSSYWYAHEIAKPMDLPILSGALERLMKKWYSEIKSNPETILMDAKEYSNRIKPLIEVVEKEFEGTDYSERMKNSIVNMNRMSINEQFTNFFYSIGLVVGKKEKKALRARNFSAHGSFRDGEDDLQEQFLISKIYECLVARVVLKLIGYDGNYVDYGTIGFPERNINNPIGDDI